jgi:hypothetical protein
MCLAIVKPPYADIPEEHLAQAFCENPDGVGFAVANRGMLTIKKGLFLFDDFLTAWYKLDAFKMPVLVHFRWATSGKTNKFNCHPWAISDKLAVIHNGVLPWSSSSKMSDTGCFVQEVLIPNEGKIRSKRFRESIEDFIGVRNKLAFLDSSGRLTIYNEDSGHWNGGVWYSNGSYVDWREFDDEYSTTVAIPGSTGADANERRIAF